MNDFIMPGSHWAGLCCSHDTVLIRSPCNLKAKLFKSPTDFVNLNLNCFRFVCFYNQKSEQSVL